MQRVFSSLPNGLITVYTAGNGLFIRWKNLDFMLISETFSSEVDQWINGEYILIKRKTYTTIFSTFPPPPYVLFMQDKRRQSALKKSEKNVLHSCTFLQSGYCEYTGADVSNFICHYTLNNLTTLPMVTPWLHPK